jgi:hypothetical protein
MSYLIQKASIVRDAGLLRVSPIEDGDPQNSMILYVVESPTKCLTLRAGRPVYDEENRLTPDFILIVEKPDFEIKSIIGMHLSSIRQ